jgi:uncharacterized protein (DUF1810 family)
LSNPVYLPDFTLCQTYAIRSLDEARAYLDHPLLGPRLNECCEALLTADPSASAEQILGSIDAIKARSSITLFHRADPSEQHFQAVLTRFDSGDSDPKPNRLLRP